MTMIDIRVPSESFEGTRSQIVRWLAAAGQAVRSGDPLIEVETDKVTMEIAAPASGVLAEILKAEQEEIDVGDLLGRIDVVADARATAAAAVVPRPVPNAPVPPAVSAHAATAAAGLAAAGISAAVRRLLVQHDLEATAVAGTGAGGRITVDDVLRHVGALESGGAAPPPAAGRAGVRRVPHTATRRRIAAHMVESLLRTAPHVTTVFEADLGAILAHRGRERAAFASDGVPLTLTAYFVSACVAALHAVPEANARWTEDALEYLEQIDIGIGTAVEGKGLVVPVIRDVAALDLRGIAARLNDLATRARTDSLTPADVRGGTFTISNHGVSGSLLATPIIINQPQSAILGIGKLEKRAVVVEAGGVESIVVRPRCYVTLTLDHRVMDGHQANRFLTTWVDAIERFGG